MEFFLDLSSIGALSAFICYVIATLAVIIRLFHPKGPNLVIVLLFGCLGIVFHSITTSHFLFSNHNIDFALPNVISLVSLIITITITTIALRFKINLLLPVTYSFAGVWLLISLFIPHDHQTPLVTSQLPVFIHVTLALLAYCVLIIATLYAFQVAYINMKLKNKNLTAVSHLPPLMQVEGQLFTILAIGTLCLFLSQMVGVVFMEQFISKSNAHKTVLSLLALVIYTTILWGHYKQGWRGHRVLMLTISASALLTLAYFGSRFVKEFLLY